MFTRPLNRSLVTVARKVHNVVSCTHVSPLSSVVGVVGPSAQQHRPQHLGGTAATTVGVVPHTWIGGSRQFTAVKDRGRRKHAKVTREELEAQEEVARRVNNPPDQVEKSWEYDEPSQFAQLAQSENDEVPPTPILDAYEKSRCPKEMERLIQMSFDVLPKRDGPRRNNHKRREKQRFKTIRNIRWKEKAQRMAAYERKLQKRRDRKAREEALFATWRTSDSSGPLTSAGSSGAIA